MTYDWNNKPTKSQIPNLKKDVLKKILSDNNLDDSGTRDVLSKRVRDFFYNNTSNIVEDDIESNTKTNTESNTESNTKSSTKSNTKSSTENNNNLKTTKYNLNNKPTKSQIPNLKKDVLKKILSDNNLDYSGTRDVLSKRVRDFFYNNTSNVVEDNIDNNINSNTSNSNNSNSVEDDYNNYDKEDEEDEDKDEIKDEDEDEDEDKNENKTKIICQIVVTETDIFAVDIESLRIYERDTKGKFRIQTSNYWDVETSSIKS